MRATACGIVGLTLLVPGCTVAFSQTLGASVPSLGWTALATALIAGGVALLFVAYLVASDP